ncbi:MAG: VOC family protein [Gammaproteobacteria bacterium]|nr:VOC family protein [Gammaproteobacteria bacterium]
MQLGNFSVCLTVKDIAVSKQFYETLGFVIVAGDETQKWLVLKNGTARIGLFQGMFDKNMLTFNPGWDENKQELKTFMDVRDIQNQLKKAHIKFDQEAVEGNEPTHFMITDPDGNPILVDQHVKRVSQDTL